jgi:hypothetical protein
LAEINKYTEESLFLVAELGFDWLIEADEPMIPPVFVFNDDWLSLL